MGIDLVRREIMYPPPPPIFGQEGFFRVGCVCVCFFLNSRGRNVSPLNPSVIHLSRVFSRIRGGGVYNLATVYLVLLDR